MRSRRAVLLCLAAGFLGSDLASASGYGLFQQGGRAMGQVGALTARAPDPSALTYNPAAITRLPGFQLQTGLDFNTAEDNYESASGRFNTRHIIQFPPLLYATWKGEDNPFAFGIGLDAPFWYVVEWPIAFPGRFLNHRFMLRVFELHPVLAYDLGGGWSLGGGVRYLYGSTEQEHSAVVPVFVAGTGTVPVEVERNAEAEVDDITWDLALHYVQPAWGWGAVYRGAANLKGNGDVDYRPRDVPLGIPGLESQVAARFGTGGRASQAFELPRELRGGVWVAPYPELRLELDAAWQSWSSLESTAVTYDPDPVGDGPTVLTPRDWEDTLSLRLGVEGDITDALALFGGVALEPSPVPGDTVEPGFPRGDAWVYAAGFTYNFPKISFDLGYSFHQHNSRGVTGHEPQNPGRSGRYLASDQVWGFGVRWRF